MKKIFLLCFITTIVQSQSIPSKAFDYLDTHRINFDEKYKTIESISFDPAISELINIRFEELDESDHFFAEECEGSSIKLLITKIDRSSDKEYIITYNMSCCCDYGFSIYESITPYKQVGRIIANRMFVPGNGNIYADGRLFKYYNQSHKYTLVGDSLQQVKQPFSYVGLKTKTLNTIKLFSDKDLVNLVAQLPPNYEVEVLLNDNNKKDIYLIKSSFGLIGWAKIETGQYESIDIEGIYYWGD